MSRFPDGDENNPLGGEKRVQPSGRLGRVARNKQDAIRPTCGEMVRIVDAVRIEKTVPLGDLITPTASTKKIEGTPESKFVKRKLEKACGPGALAKTIGVCDNNYLARHSQHLADDSGGIGDMMKRGGFADRIKRVVWKGQGLPAGLQDGNAREIADGTTLLKKGGHGLDTTYKDAREGFAEIAKAAARCGADVEKTLHLE